MFNVGGGEFLVILLVALIVLGPAKLPEAAKQVGAMARELRRISAGFQQELKSALDEPVEEEARTRGQRVVSSEEQPAPAANSSESDPAEPMAADPAAAKVVENSDAPGVGPSEPMSTAEAAGMYDLVKPESAPEPADAEPDHGSDRVDTEPGAEPDHADTEPADAEADHGSDRADAEADPA